MAKFEKNGPKYFCCLGLRDILEEKWIHNATLRAADKCKKIEF